MFFLPSAWHLSWPIICVLILFFLINLLLLISCWKSLFGSYFQSSLKFAQAILFWWASNVVSVATGCGLDGGVRFSAPVQTGPGAHPASCTMGTGSFPGVKSGRGGTLTPHPLLEPWSWKGRAIPLLPLWAVRPVQSLSACTGVTFTFTFLSYSAIY